MNGKDVNYIYANYLSFIPFKGSSSNLLKMQHLKNIIDLQLLWMAINSTIF